MNITKPKVQILPAYQQSENAYKNSSSKKTFRLVALAMRDLGGSPITSMIAPIWSFSFSPAKSGMPAKHSNIMQPKLHMSMAVVQGMPSMISGALQNLDQMQVQYLSNSKQLLPKSINLMFDLFGFTSSTFSGFRSQCTMLYLNMQPRATSSQIANRFVNAIEKPWKSLFFMNWYKFILSISNVMHYHFGLLKDIFYLPHGS